MEKDDVKIPDNIASMTEEQRKDVARGLMKTTRLNNDRIAQTTGLGRRAIATMRLHVQGKVPNPPTRTAAQDGRPKEQPVEEAAVFPVEKSTVLHDIDAPAPEVKPAPVEREAVHIESDVRDLRSRVEGVDAKLSMVLAAVKNGTVGTAPKEQVEERTMSPSFDTIKIPIAFDTYRLALFSSWKSNYNIEAAQSGGRQYAKDFDGFVLDCLDEFFDQRNIDLTYTQTTRMRPQMPQMGGR